MAAPLEPFLAGGEIDWVEGSSLLVKYWIDEAPTGIDWGKAGYDFGEGFKGPEDRKR